MLVDEFYFHRKRGLPKWERWGHPLDTVSVLLCYLFVLNFPPNVEHYMLFFGLCLFSCFFITKDEFEHKKNCTAAEQWLHSILFIFHPLVLMVTGVSWYLSFVDPSLNFSLWIGIRIQTGLTLLFLIYQITYWNILWKPNQQ